MSFQAWLNMGIAILVKVKTHQYELFFWERERAHQYELWQSITTRHGTRASLEVTRHLLNISWLILLMIAGIWEADQSSLESFALPVNLLWNLPNITAAMALVNCLCIFEHCHNGSVTCVSQWTPDLVLQGHPVFTQRAYLATSNHETRKTFFFCGWSN